MPRYYFHVHDGSEILDDEGSDFPDLTSVRHAAIRACGEMLSDVPGIIHRGETWRMWVTDQPDGEGQIVFRLNVSASNK
jgi:hypothetical protein